MLRDAITECYSSKAGDLVSMMSKVAMKNTKVLDIHWKLELIEEVAI